jgi:DNA repair protein RecN (Recombination protein N)
MLSHLYIRDFTIIHTLELDLDAGLTVLTGETGAGKSVLIDALALVLGQRADNSVIRHGCKRTEISAAFDLKPEQDAARWLQEQDLFADGECVVRRLIEADRPTKGFINGRPASMQMLRELGDFLVDIHGQHEHQSLLKRDNQRQVLDDYAGISETVERVGAHYREWNALRERLHTLKAQAEDRSARIELLRYQVSELEALDLQPGELASIEEEHSRLANGAELLEGVQAIAHELYDSDEGAISNRLGTMVQRLEGLVQHDGRLGEVLNLLNEAAIQVDEAASALHNYSDRLELDPERLSWLDQRLAAISDLARKHRVDAEELPAILARLQTELTDIEDFDVNLSKLEASIETERQAYVALATELTVTRTSAAKDLGEAVTARMQDLGMPGGTFAVTLAPLPDGEFSSTGQERIEFQVSANPGQPLLPLSKVASGGELSRISLALQVIIAGVGRVPTLIFDEVDVGIGGRVAEIVGQQLRDLGRSRQVLCITHQAQVAAQGNQHLQVAKETADGETMTRLYPLGEAERVQEIARMIGGIEISRQTLDHAEDMLNRVSA